MNSSFRPRRRAGSLLIVAVLALVGLAGCQGHRVVARVGSQIINEEEFNDRAQRVRNVNPQSNLDAGGVALVEMIREAMVDQLVKEKGWNPPEEAVQKMVAWQKRSDWRLQNALKEGLIDDAELLRGVRNSMQEFAIGVDGAKVEEKDLDEAYKKNREQLKIPDMFVARILPVPSEQVGVQAITELKTNPDFKAVAQKVIPGLPPQALPNIGKETILPADRISPSLRAELEKLSPGQFTPKPVAFQATNPQTGMPSTAYIIAQLVEKRPGGEPTLDEARPMLQRIVLEETRRDWAAHKDQLLAEFVQRLVANGQIQINIKRYQPLLEQVILTTAANRMILPPPPGAAPGGAPPGSPPPGSPGAAGPSTGTPPGGP